MAEIKVKVQTSDGGVHCGIINVSEAINPDVNIVSIMVALPEADKPEKPQRKIDGYKFRYWALSDDQSSISGQVVWGADHHELTHPHSICKSQAELIRYAPDAMRFLIDYVNWCISRRSRGWLLTPANSKRFDRAVKIINDAGFEDDIA